MLRREAVSSPDTPEIKSSAEHLRSLLWLEMKSFLFLLVVVKVGGGL